MALPFSVLPSNEKAGAQRRRPVVRTARHPRRSRRSARETRQTRARGRQPSSTRWRRSHGRARSSLQRFRQATILAVALTSIVLLVGTAAEDEAGQPAVASPQNAAIDGQESVGEGASQPGADIDPHQSLEEATTTIRDQLGNPSVEHHQLQPRFLLHLGRGHLRRRQRKRPRLYLRRRPCHRRQNRGAHDAGAHRQLPPSVGTAAIGVRRPRPVASIPSVPWSGPRRATVDAATSGGGPKASCGTDILSRAIGDRFPRHQSCTAMRRLRRTKATNRFSGG